MGKRGPQALPTALKLIAGERQSARINDDEPMPREGIPDCPQDASDEAREVWNYTINELDHMKVLTMADRDNLYAYCEAVVMHRTASAIIAREGVLIEGRLHGGWVKNPACQIQRDAAASMRAFAKEFGLTPSARTGIKVAATQPSTTQGAGRLLSG